MRPIWWAIACGVIIFMLTLIVRMATADPSRQRVNARGYTYVSSGTDSGPAADASDSGVGVDAVEPDASEEGYVAGEAVGFQSVAF